MGSKYTTQAISGYNSSPPPDDGSQSASNLITWAAQKSKLADPIKTQAAAIDTALVAALDYSVRQVTASDNTVAGDHMKTVEIAPTVSSAIAVSLGDASTMTTNYIVRVKNSSTINQTIGRVTSGDTIDGVAGDLTIPPKSSIILSTNSTPDGYLTLAKNGPFLDTDALVAGSSDGSKKVRFELDGFTTGTTRVLTPPDTDTKIGPSVVAVGRNIAARTNSSTPNTKIDITANELLLKDSNSLALLASTVSVTIDFGTTGANGLDSGSQASSTWYYGYVIAKPDGTVAGLGSTSSTAPTLPTGYTFKALVTAVRSDGSTHFVKYRQFGNKVFYETYQEAFSGTTPSTETAVDVSAIVPPIASTFDMNIGFGFTGNVANDAMTLTLRVISGSDFWVNQQVNPGGSNTIRGQGYVSMPNISQQYYHVRTLSGSPTSPSDFERIHKFTLPVAGE